MERQRKEIRVQRKSYFFPGAPHIYSIPTESHQARMRSEGFENEQALDDTVKKLEADLKKARRKFEGLEEEPGVRQLKRWSIANVY